MYRFYINRADNEYRFNELIRVFLPDDAFETIAVDFPKGENVELTNNSYLINGVGDTDSEAIKRELYELLRGITGKSPSWGTLTGVRPLKPIFELYERTASLAESVHAMQERYLISDEKVNLLREVLTYQLENVRRPIANEASVYVGIPFCPTRCAYCSFEAAVAKPEAVAAYLDKLLQEIKYVGERNSYRIESVYIGGGTPTICDSAQLDSLISTIADSFQLDPSSIEFTVEAGRPDTITADKLQTLKDHGIERISINPQSMNDRTLSLIGRSHYADDIRKAYDLAREIGFDVVNADVITGLPEETAADFTETLSELIRLGANNITVHTLSVKRGSRINAEDPGYYLRYGEVVTQMLDIAGEMLRAAGYKPYYIYRQKHQIGALENIGWCLPGKHSIYNIRIMEDKQTIIGLGAGAIGKVYYPHEDRLERIPNVDNYRIYIERFDEMIKRKNLYFGGE